MMALANSAKAIILLRKTVYISIRVFHTERERKRMRSVQHAFPEYIYIYIYTTVSLEDISQFDWIAIIIVVGLVVAKQRINVCKPSGDDYILMQRNDR